MEVMKMCDDFFDGIDEEDWAIIGPLSEELAEEKKRRKQLEEDLYPNDEEPW